MQVFCPRCNTGYEIDDELLKVKSKRLRCGNCGEIFTVDKITDDKAQEDTFSMLQEVMGEQFEAGQKTVDENPTEVSEDNHEDSESNNVADDSAPKEAVTNETDAKTDTNQDNPKSLETTDEEFDIEDIFERLSERTENLINEEKKLPIHKKIWLWIRNILGLQFRINWKYVGGILVVAGLVWLYNNRYDVVRSMPFMNGLYKTVGINAKIVGEGLEFQNISWDMLAEGEDKRLDIRGFIFNQTDKSITIPLVHVEILDKETLLLQSQNRTLETTIVGAGEKVPLLISVTNPAPTLKYVYMTFIDVD